MGRGYTIEDTWRRYVLTREVGGSRDNLSELSVHEPARYGRKSETRHA
jgi:hypothetical protein